MRIISPNKEQLEFMRGIWDDVLIDQVNRGELLSHAVIDFEEEKLIAIYVLDVFGNMISVVNYFCVPEYEEDYGIHTVVFDDILGIAEATEIDSIIVPDDAFGYYRLKNYLDDYGFKKETESKLVTEKVDNIVKVIPERADAGVKSLSEATAADKKAVRNLIKEIFEVEIGKDELDKVFDQECSSLYVNDGKVKAIALASYAGDHVYLDYLYASKDAVTPGMTTVRKSASTALEKYGKGTKFETLIASAESEKLAKKLIPNGEYKDFSFYRWNIA